MSKISEFYVQRDELLKSSGQIELEDKLMAREEKLLREELLPEVGKALLPLLRKVKTSLTLNINYMPDGALAMSFTRNSMMVKIPKEVENVENENNSDDYASPIVDSTEVEEPMPTDEEQTSDEDDTAKDEQNNGNYVIAFFPNGNEVRLPIKTLKKFRVVFPDGTAFCETQGRVTLKKTLRKIGLKRICKEATEIQHAGYQLVSTIPCRDEKGKFQNHKQDQVDGYYMYKNTDSPDKIADILKLNRKFSIGLKVYSYEGVDLTDVVDFKENRESDKKKDTIDIPKSDKTTIKELFEEWLYRNMSYNSVNSYLSTLKNSVRYFIHKYVDEDADSVFSFITVSEMEMCIELLETIDEFKEVNVQKHNAPRATMKKWMQFLQELEKEKKG